MILSARTMIQLALVSVTTLISLGVNTVMHYILYCLMIGIVGLAMYDEIQIRRHRSEVTNISKSVDKRLAPPDNGGKVPLWRK